MGLPANALIGEHLGMTKVIDGDLVKGMRWYDNEWGYTNQMIKEAVRITKERL